MSQYIVLDDEGRAANFIIAPPVFAESVGALPYSSDVEIGDRWNGEAWVGFRDEAKAQLAAIRWGKTQLFSYDGEAAAYADAAIAVTTAKIRALEESGSTDPVNFKLTATAWRSWTLTDLKAYGAAIDAHIQACFDNEAALAEAINAAADLDALRAIDLDAGWP